VLELGLDSLKLLEIILELDKMGIPVNLKEAWGIQTVGEAYEYYQREFSNDRQDKR
jgi:acyl carrier protein